MLTLEEAVAELDKLLAFGWIEDRVGTRVNADEIRAAVRDVAIEAMRQMQERSGYVWEGGGELKAEINRLLGDHPHG